MPGKAPFQKRLVDELHALVIMAFCQGKRQGGPDVLDGFLHPTGIGAGSGQGFAKLPRSALPYQKLSSPGFTAFRSK
jgi:hypothetical protein